MADAEAVHSVDDLGDIERVLPQQSIGYKIIFHELDGSPYVLSRYGWPEGSAGPDAIGPTIRMNLEHQVIADGSHAVGELDRPYVRNSYGEYIHSINLHLHLLKCFAERNRLFAFGQVEVQVLFVQFNAQARRFRNRHEAVLD